jgi:hypothetical protein
MQTMDGRHGAPVPALYKVCGTLLFHARICGGCETLSSFSGACERHTTSLGLLAYCSVVACTFDMLHLCA